MMRRPPAPGVTLRLRLQLALLLLPMLPAVASAQARDLPLGRLFHTQEERSQLNARRTSDVPGGQQALAAQQAASAEIAPAPPEALQLNGVLQRSNGESTVWMNQQAQSGKGVRKDRTVSLQLPSGKRVILKPGQSYDESDGTVRDASH